MASRHARQATATPTIHTFMLLRALQDPRSCSGAVHVTYTLIARVPYLVSYDAYAYTSSILSRRDVDILASIETPRQRYIIDVSLHWPQKRRYRHTHRPTKQALPQERRGWRFNHHLSLRGLYLQVYNSSQTPFHAHTCGTV